MLDALLLYAARVSVDHYLDINMHAVPTLLLLADLLLFSPPWTITSLPALGLSGTLAVAYWFWVEHCFKYNGESVAIILSLTGWGSVTNGN